MKPSKELIEALRSVANDIEGNACYYSWSNSAQCNCGLLAQKLLKDDKIPNLNLYMDLRCVGLWTGAAHRYEKCEQTGLPIPEILKALKKHGLDWEDFGMIENLSMDGDYVTAPNPARNVRPNVIKFFRDLADKLEAELKAAELTKPTKVLGVDETLFGVKEKKKKTVQQQQLL